MYLEETKIFIDLIRAELTKTSPKEVMLQAITPEMMEKLYRVASKQDMAHVVGVALKRNKLLGNDNLSKLFLRSIHFALLRYETLKHAQSQIYEVFEKEKIVYVPLKGAVIRELYPEPWMRTSCDIDILVKEEELERAKEALMNDLGYKVSKYNYHDISMYSPSNVHLELHFKILENEENIDCLLKRVWNYVQPIESGSYQYKMTSEYFVFHALAHMMYHFIHGGCGARYIVDMWILENKTQYDKVKLTKLCQECDIDVFAYYTEKMMRVWFEGEKHDALSEKMQMYIMNGGVFGSNESIVTARKTKVEGKVKYLLQRIFVPYEELCVMNPTLKKYSILYPYYTMKRWLKIFRGNTVNRAMNEIKLNKEIKQDSVNELKDLFRKLKL